MSDMDQFGGPPANETNQPLDLIPHPVLHSRAGLAYPAGRYVAEWSDESHGDVSVVQYWRIVRRHRKTILWMGLLGLLAGWAAGIPMKPVYRAKTSLEVLSFNEDFLNVKETNPVSSNGTSNDTSAEENQARLLESQSLRERVSTKLGYRKVALDALPDVASSGWRKWLHLPPLVSLSPRESLVNAAADTLKVTVTPRTHILTASVESSDRHLAADYVNGLAREFIQQSMEARWTNSERTGQWLRREIEGARDRLRDAENALQSYARDSGLIFTDDNSNVASEKLQDMQQVLLAATSDRIAKQSRFELVKNSPPEALPDLLSEDQSLREISSKMNDLRRQIALLTASVYTPHYSKVKEAQAELDTLQAAFNQNRADVVKRIENDYQQSQRKEDLLSEAYNTQVREVTGQSEKTIQYNILKRDVESNRQLYDNMLQQMKQATIAAAVHVSNVRVVDKAEVPTRPISPDFRLNSAVGLLAGILLSVLAVIVREQTDSSFRQPEEVKLCTDLPVLGAIPTVGAALTLQYRLRTLLNQAPALLPMQQQMHLTADAFRSTLTSILFQGKKSQCPKVLVFTSANVADGKTTSTTNLAIAAAEIGKRVLVIDADLRRPRVHEVFDVPNEQGLAELLAADMPDEQVQATIYSTAISGLDVLTAGTATDAAPQLLYSPRLGQLLRRVQGFYDLVLIDTPPMLQMPDARLVGALADGVVLVVRASQTDRAMLLAAQRRFLEDNTRVLGTILNGWDPGANPSHYYREYPRYHTAAGAR